MDLTSATVKSGFSVNFNPTLPGVGRKPSIGYGDKQTVYPLASIAGVYVLLSAAAANAFTHTLATGVVAQTTGSGGTITKGDGKDAEGITFPTLAKIMGLRITAPATNTGTVTLAGSSSGKLPAKVLVAGERVTCEFPAAGLALSAATLIHTFSAAGDQVLVEFLAVD